MRIVIAGGTGLIGRALAKDLAGAGAEVAVLTRDPQGETRLPKGAQIAGWDGRTASGWGHLAEGVDAIVNLAGENISAGPWTDERKRRILESRLNAGQAILQAIESATNKPRVVIQASAVGYYGAHGDEDVTEESPPGEDFLARVCVKWEASTAPVEAMGVRHVITRTGVVLSRRGGALPRLVMPARLFAGGPLGSGRQWFPWIHIADEVSAIRFLMDRDDARGPFNLTAPQTLTNRRFSKVLGGVIRRPSLLRTPACALRLLFGEMALVLLEGQRAVPKRLTDLGFRFRFPEASSALHDLLD